MPDEWGDIIGLHLGWLKGGYGWIFPKGDHLNIGVCSWKYNGPNLRESLGGLALIDVNYYCRCASIILAG